MELGGNNLSVRRKGGEDGGGVLWLGGNDNRRCEIPGVG